jgi:hypothetical protein
VESIIRKLRSEIKLLRKEYNELNEDLQQAQDFYYNHKGKSCERLIQQNCELKSMLTKEKGNNLWNLEYLCLLFYKNLIDRDKYNNLIPDEDIHSYSMLEYHLMEDKSAQEIVILKYEDKDDAIERLEWEKSMEETKVKKNNNINMNSKFSTKERANAPVEEKKKDEPIVLYLTPEIIAKAKKGELNETK